MTMVVGADGVTELDDGFGEPGFNVGGVPFERWMNGNHLDDAGTVMCCGWESVENAHESGELRHRYADERAAAIEEADCDHTERGCP